MPETTHVAVDVGGTFTDVTLLNPDGRLVTAKVPSTADQSEGVLAGIRKAAEIGECPLSDVDRFTHSTTVAVNALLEEAGARTALVTTEGFRDVLEIGRQDRPDLYDTAAARPEPLVPRDRRYEISERSGVDGPRRAPESDAIERLIGELETAVDEGSIESIAVCFLHAYAHTAHEQRLGRRLREQLEVPVSCSHEVLPEFREYERTSTTVTDAYLAPVVGRYLDRLLERARRAGLPEPFVMQANGGTATVEEVVDQPVTTVLSGPAAGVVGARAAVEHPGEVITFDMGGTSTDVSLAGEDGAALTTDVTVGGRPIKTAMVDVHTVGAGGGSIAWVDDGGALRVGPQSAGAQPGPACYGKGGTRPTVTDANLALGYLGADTRLGGEMSLDAEAAETALSDLAEEAGLAGPVEAARGIYRVAVTRMSRAVRRVTLERGRDPRSATLVGFGGAGPMHAAALAEELGIETVVIPRSCGVLSAYGLLAAPERQDRVQTVRTLAREAEPDRLGEIYERLESEARARLSSSSSSTEATPDDGNADGEHSLASPGANRSVAVRRAADLRYRGQSFELTVLVDPEADLSALVEAFHEAHRTTYGYRMDDPVELVNLRLTARRPTRAPSPAFAGGDGRPRSERPTRFQGDSIPTPVYDWANLEAEQSLAGPAVVERNESTALVPPGWSATVRPDGSLRLTADTPR